MVGYIGQKKVQWEPTITIIQEQKCLLIKGQFISIYKDLVDDKSVKVTHVVNEGDMIVTQPNVAHTMVFTKDTIFLNLVRGERYENYGITHKFLQVVDENEKTLETIINLIVDVAVQLNLRVLSLGYQPLANNLLYDKNENTAIILFSLNVYKRCFNCQLSVSVDSKEMFLIIFINLQLRKIWNHLFMWQKIYQWF